MKNSPLILRLLMPLLLLLSWTQQATTMLPAKKTEEDLSEGDAPLLATHSDLSSDGEVTFSTSSAIARLDDIKHKKFHQDVLNPIMLELFGKKSDGWCAALSEFMRMIDSSEWDHFYSEITDRKISPKSKILLQFICNHQTNTALNNPCTLAEQSNNPLSLKLRNGTSINARSPRDLAEKLKPWAEKIPKGRYVWIGKDAKALHQTIRALKEGEVYILDVHMHTMLLQRTGLSISIFDPTTGVSTVPIADFYLTPSGPDALAFWELETFYGILSIGDTQPPKTPKFEFPDNSEKALRWIIQSARRDDTQTVRKVLELGFFKPIENLIKLRPAFVRDLCIGGMVNAVKLLISQGYNINFVDTGNKNTLLHYAAVSGNTELIQFILNSGGKAQLNQKNAYKIVPLAFAQHFKRPEAVKLLTEEMHKAA